MADFNTNIDLSSYGPIGVLLLVMCEIGAFPLSSDQNYKLSKTSNVVLLLINFTKLGSDFFNGGVLVNTYPGIPALGSQNAGFLQNIANFNKLVLRAPMELEKNWVPLKSTARDTLIPGVSFFQLPGSSEVPLLEVGRIIEFSKMGSAPPYLKCTIRYMYSIVVNNSIWNSNFAATF